jgi:hypothetical protein
MTTPNGPLYSLISSGVITHIALNGSIESDFDIPLSVYAHANVLKIDMQKVDLIDSEGTRLLVKWFWEVEKVRPGLQVKMEKVGPVIVRQFSMVKDFLSPNVVVESIFVPLFCESCDLEDLSTLVSADEVRALGDIAQFMPKLVPCPKCNVPMELDCDPSKYFNVLLGQTAT